MNTDKLCCGGLGLFGKCGRGQKKGCNGAHCRCMGNNCTNMHYVDCFEHYVHVEHTTNTEEEWFLDKKYWKTFAGGKNPGTNVNLRISRPNIPAILQEQKKRDWEEFRGIIDELIEENKHLMERDPELDAGMNYVRDVLRIRTANRLQD